MTTDTQAEPTYILLRDGVEVLRGTYIEIVNYIHRHHCYSVDHATKYEGYAITRAELGMR